VGLVRPKLLALDSSTLGRLSNDFWSRDVTARDKARAFLCWTKSNDIFFAFTCTHVMELLRHNDQQIAHDRIRFLGTLPFIAWLRPYDRHWFPGSIVDLLLRELEVYMQDGDRGWLEIVKDVRQELWETGLGSEMFIDDENLWSGLRIEAQSNLQREIYLSSVARTDPARVGCVRLAELFEGSIRSREDRERFCRSFARTMCEQLKLHGDPRLQDQSAIALDFARMSLEGTDYLVENKTELVEALLLQTGVPRELISLDMTQDELGELCIYSKRIEMLGKRLMPRQQLSAVEVPPSALPAYDLERKLARLQKKANRVRGSDFGDAHIAPLVFYTDGVEVDKRTAEYLNQVKRKYPETASIMGFYFSSSNYSDIPLSLNSRFKIT
jgi:hypothetical protein